MHNPMNIYHGIHSKNTIEFTCSRISTSHLICCSDERYPILGEPIMGFFQFKHETFHVRCDKDLNNTFTENMWDLGAGTAPPL